MKIREKMRVCVILLITGCTGAPLKDTERSAVPSGGTLPPPVQLSPAEGMVFSNVPRTTILEWDAVPGAAAYGVDIDCYHSLYCVS